ncbi:type II toxin-antitoxin system ParD family antitoxin [Sphingobium lactosutens]|uniref:type II toxin-antitoxin system ParD family antitoxin n=1 Tax=Sphingobium lactosutens TaxID=522773 RepID=UPI0015B8D1DC|nr:type II toxin-antitoxin system ParD family antitoxin [Sphingobium lactosutens]NWK98469.1 type II toxin-antitoxin system ParD family antitoxin [Sphingobium lactosutens]
MANLNIPMPPALEQWVDVRLAQGRYADAADYIRDLIRRDQEAAEEDRQWVRAKIEEGFASGVIDAEPEDVLREIMARLPDA